MEAGSVLPAEAEIESRGWSPLDVGIERDAERIAVVALVGFPDVADPHEGPGRGNGDVPFEELEIGEQLARLFSQSIEVAGREHGNGKVPRELGAALQDDFVDAPFDLEEYRSGDIVHVGTDTQLEPVFLAGHPDVPGAAGL